MKVTQGHITELNANKKTDKEFASNEAGAAAALNPQPPNAASGKADFAGVLAKVTRSHSEKSHHDAERGSDDGADKSEGKIRDRDGADTSQLVASNEQPLRHEVVSQTDDVSSDARTFLQSVDFDRIVTACQVQLAHNGQPAVTLELSRSMLEGLKVKVSTDGSGRITTEFLAANEGIKSLLDARSAELIEQLRARGISTAEFKSSIAADSNNANQSSRDQQPNSVPERRSGRIEAVASLSDEESATPTNEGQAANAIYRA
jgi:hypothetical protein